VVWWVLLLQTVFALWFTLLVPIYRGPDEALHVDMVRRHQTEAGYPDAKEFRTIDAGVTASQQRVDEWSGGIRLPLRIEDAQPRQQRPTFQELGDTWNGPRFRSQMSQHPPLYYATVGGASRLATSLVPEEAWSWDREVLLLRLLSVLMLAVVPLLAAEAARGLGTSPVVGALAAALLLCVPGFTVLRALVNNDALAIALASVAVAGSVQCLRRADGRWLAVTTVAAAGSLLTKSTAAPVAVWALGAVVVAILLRSDDRSPKAVAGRFALVAGVALLGASWHLTQLVRYADPQPSPVVQALPDGAADTAVSRFAEVWIERVSANFFGQPARRTGVTLPDWQIHAAAAGFVVFLLAGIVFAVRSRRGTVLALGGLVLLQVLMMLRPNWKGYSRSGRFSGFQGRYLYPCIVAIVLLVAVGLWRLLRSRSVVVQELVPRAVVLLGIGMHATLMWSTLTDGYWDDAGRGTRGLLDSLAAWSPLPWVLTVGAGVGGAAVVGAASVAQVGGVVGSWRSRRRGDGATAAP
jgi:hypothetical protein